MFMVTDNGLNCINLDRIVSLSILQNNDRRWEIRAIYSEASYITIKTFCSKTECMEAFVEIQNKISDGKRFGFHVINLNQ